MWVRSLEYIFSKYKWYWAIAAFLHAARIRLQARYFWVMNWGDEQSLLRTRIFYFFRISSSSIFVVVGVIGLIVLVEKNLNILVQGEVSADTYDTMLGTIAGISGVVIGLYYAAISSIGTSVYSQFPMGIRDLLTKEPDSNAYIKFLAFVTFYCVGLLWLRFLGYEPSFIGGLIAMLLSGVGLFTIVFLGQRVLHMGDPTILTAYIFRTIQRQMRLASVEGYAWFDIEFQKHYSSETSKLMNSLSIISEIIKDQPYLKTQSHLEFARDTAMALSRYSKFRKKIPTTSSWYPAINKHTSWYQASDTKLQFAGASGYLHFESIKDTKWVESNLLKIVLECFTTNLSAKTLTIANEAAQLNEHCCTVLISNFESNLATSFYDDILKKFRNFISTSPVDPDDQDNTLRLLALASRIYTIPSIFITTLHRELDLIQKATAKEFISKVNWQSKKSLYLLNLPYVVLPRAEKIQKWVNFELSTEGRAISQTWYLDEQLRQQLSFPIADSINAITKSTLDIKTQEIDERKNPWLWACIADQHFENLKKLEIILARIEDQISNITEPKKITGLQWGTINFPKIFSDIKVARKPLIEDMINHAPVLLYQNRPSTYPDFGGKFLHLTGDYILNTALWENDLHYGIFSHYFVTSLVNFDQLRKPLQDCIKWQEENILLIAAAPLVDLVTISGNLILISKFHKNPSIEKIVRDVWTTHMKSDPDFLKIVSQILLFSEGSGKIPHRGDVRTSWGEETKVCFISQLIQKGTTRAEYKLYEQAKIFTHEDPLVEYFINMDAFHTELQSNILFIDLFLKWHPDGQGLDFSVNQGRALRAIKDVESARNEP